METIFLISTRNLLRNVQHKHTRVLFFFFFFCSRRFMKQNYLWLMKIQIYTLPLFHFFNITSGARARRLRSDWIKVTLDLLE